MNYSVVAYFLTFVDVNHISIALYNNYEIISPHPVIECTAAIEKDESSNIQRIVHVCKTERLYRYITDIDTVEVVTEGIYKL